MENHRIHYYITNGNIGLGKTTALMRMQAHLNLLLAKGEVNFYTVVAEEPVELWMNTPVIGPSWVPTGETMDILQMSYKKPAKYRVPMQYGLLATSADRYDDARYVHYTVVHDCDVVVLVERGYAAGKAFIMASGDIFDDFTRTMYHMYLSTLTRLLADRSIIGKVYMTAPIDVLMQRIMKRSRDSEMGGIKGDYLAALTEAMDDLHGEDYHFDASEDHTGCELEFYKPLVDHVISCYQSCGQNE